MKLTIEIERGPEGGFLATCKEVKGMFVLENSLAEAMNEVSSVLGRLLEAMEADDIPASERPLLARMLSR